MSRHVKRQYASGVLSVHASAGDASSVRCVRVAGLLAEEVSEFHPSGSAEGEAISAVRIVASTTGGWRVEAHADGQGPYAACYPATSLNGALRVAGLLLRGERVPADYRNWS